MAGVRMITPIDPLPNEVEAELIVDHQCGDVKAMETILKANAKWLAKWASRYTSDFVPHEDLFQAGCVAVIEAANKYVPQDGKDFRAFAQHYVRREMSATVAAYYPGLSMSRRSFDRHGLTEMGSLVDAGTLEDITGERVSFIERDLVVSMLKTLTTRHRRVIVMAYGLTGEPLPDVAIAARLHVERSVATKLRHAALAELRANFPGDNDE